MTRHRSHRGWRRADSERIDPAELFADLQGRTLTDLERCRVAWQRAGDPLALCVAVAGADIPEWLGDALLYLLAVDGRDGGNVLRRGWRERERAAFDRERAQALAGVRGHPKIRETWGWETSAKVAESLAHQRFDDVPYGTPDAIRKAYARVHAGLSNPGRYYCPPARFKAHLVAALTRVRGIFAVGSHEVGTLVSQKHSPLTSQGA